ncbi:MAG: hypothetical protein JNM63_09775 [Spirochaetia bacterium]|nr:hypothetical protein [Spirochaetia bacterium]
MNLRRWILSNLFLLTGVFLFAEDWVVDLRNSRDAAVFSDKDEKKGSQTEVGVKANGDILETSYRIVPGTEAGNAYAGFAFKVALPEGKDFQSVRFDLRISSGDADPTSVTLTIGQAKRARIDLRKYGTVVTEWKNFHIALEDFGVEKDEVPRIRSFAVKIAGWEKGGPMPAELSGRVALKNLQFSTDKAAPKNAVMDYSFLASKKLRNPKRGATGWIYGRSLEECERIKAWNKNSSKPVSMLLVYAGSLDFEKGGAKFTGLDSGVLQFYRDQLPPEVEVHANVDASAGKNLGLLSREEQESLAKKVALEINRLACVDGLNVDIEPYVSEALPFYIYLKKYLEKPLGAALGAWDRHLLRVVDYPVLMNYDLALTPAKYREVAGSRFQAFAADASAAGARYFLGVPFVATHNEYEYTESRKTGERKKTPYLMEEYVAAAHQAFLEYPKIAQDPNYGGVAIWGFLDPKKKGVGAPSAEWGYFPDRIKPECWEYLSKF